MYQALYRKWRPKTFDDVVGQEQVTGPLKRQVREGRVSHAYLFVGTRGTGKTTCAKILAKAVNCEAPVDGNPCNCCRACRGIEEGSILDVEEIDAASNNGVENIRALRDEAVFTPAEVKKRVYIVDEVHMLSTSAFNALLKILEEPPEHLLFILATTELKKVPATILSRCQRFQFKRIGDEDMRRRIAYVAKEEGLELTPDAAALLARLAEGALRDGLSLLDQCAWGETIDVQRVNATVGLAGSETTESLMRAVAQGDAARALTLLDAAWREGKDVAALLGELGSLFRDALLVRILGEETSPLLSGMFPPALVRDCAGAFSPVRLGAMLDTLQAAQQELGRSTARRTTAELCLIRLCRGETGDTAALAERVALLEEAVRQGVPAARQPDAGVSPAPQSAAPARTAPRPDLVPATPAPAATRKEEPSAPAREEPSAPAKDAAPAPTQDAAADPEPAPAEGADRLVPTWREILEEAKGELGRISTIQMSNAANLTAALNGARLEIGIYSESMLEQLNQERIKAALARAVERLTGSPATVSMRVVKPEVKKRDVNELAELIKLKGLG